MNILPNTEHHLTTTCNQTEMLYSQFGLVSYLDWCRAESERMNQNGANTYVVEYPSNIKNKIPKRCCIARK